MRIIGRGRPRRAKLNGGSRIAYIDPVQASPDNYSVIFEDEHVRLLEMNVKAGESDREHSHPSETAYFVTGSMVRIHLPGGESMEMDVPDGHAMWHEEWTHRVENIGDKDLKAIIFEPK